MWHSVPFETRGSFGTPGRRKHHAMVAESSTKAWLFGGEAADSSKMYNDLWVMNFETCSWSIYVPLKNSPIPCARAGHSLELFEGRLYVFGGIDPSGKVLNDLYCFNIAERTWKLIRSSFASSSSEYGLDGPVPRTFHSCTRIQGWIFFFGGLSKSTDLSFKRTPQALETSLRPEVSLSVFDCKSDRWIPMRVEGVSKIPLPPTTSDHGTFYQKNPYHLLSVRGRLFLFCSWSILDAFELDFSKLEWKSCFQRQQTPPLRGHPSIPSTLLPVLTANGIPASAVSVASHIISYPTLPYLYIIFHDGLVIRWNPFLGVRVSSADGSDPFTAEWSVCQNHNFGMNPLLNRAGSTFGVLSADQYFLFGGEAGSTIVDVDELGNECMWFMTINSTHHIHETVPALENIPVSPVAKSLTTVETSKKVDRQTESSSSASKFRQQQPSVFSPSAPAPKAKIGAMPPNQSKPPSEIEMLSGVSSSDPHEMLLAHGMVIEKKVIEHVMGFLNSLQERVEQRLAESVESMIGRLRSEVFAKMEQFNDRQSAVIDEKIKLVSRDSVDGLRRDVQLEKDRREKFQNSAVAELAVLRTGLADLDGHSREHYATIVELKRVESDVLSVSDFTRRRFAELSNLMDERESQMRRECSLQVEGSFEIFSGELKVLQEHFGSRCTAIDDRVSEAHSRTSVLASSTHSRLAAVDDALAVLRNEHRSLERQVEAVQNELGKTDTHLQSLHSEVSMDVAALRSDFSDLDNRHSELGKMLHNVSEYSSGSSQKLEGLLGVVSERISSTEMRLSSVEERTSGLEIGRSRTEEKFDVYHAGLVTKVADIELSCQDTSRQLQSLADSTAQHFHETVSAIEEINVFSEENRVELERLEKDLKNFQNDMTLHKTDTAQFREDVQVRLSESAAELALAKTAIAECNSSLARGQSALDAKIESVQELVSIVSSESERKHELCIVAISECNLKEEDRRLSAFSDVNIRLDEICRRINDNEQHFGTRVDDQSTTLKALVAEIQTAMSVSLNEHVGTLEEKMTAMSAEATCKHDQFVALVGEKDRLAVDRHAALSTLLELQVGELQQDIRTAEKSLNSFLEQHGSRLIALETARSDAVAGLSLLDSKFSAMIATLEGSIDIFTRDFSCKHDVCLMSIAECERTCLERQDSSFSELTSRIDQIGESLGVLDRSFEQKCEVIRASVSETLKMLDAVESRILAGMDQTRELACRLSLLDSDVQSLNVAASLASEDMLGLKERAALHSIGVAGVHETIVEVRSDLRCAVDEYSSRLRALEDSFGSIHGSISTVQESCLASIASLAEGFAKTEDALSDRIGLVEPSVSAFLAETSALALTMSQLSDLHSKLLDEYVDFKKSNSVSIQDLATRINANWEAAEAERSMLSAALSAVRQSVCGFQEDADLKICAAETRLNAKSEELFEGLRCSVDAACADRDLLLQFRQDVLERLSKASQAIEQMKQDFLSTKTVVDGHDAGITLLRTLHIDLEARLLETMGSLSDCQDSVAARVSVISGALHSLESAFEMADSWTKEDISNLRRSLLSQDENSANRMDLLEASIERNVQDLVSRFSSQFADSSDVCAQLSFRLAAQSAQLNNIEDKASSIVASIDTDRTAFAAKQESLGITMDAQFGSLRECLYEKVAMMHKELNAREVVMSDKFASLSATISGLEDSVILGMTRTSTVSQCLSSLALTYEASSADVLRKLDEINGKTSSLQHYVFDTLRSELSEKWIQLSNYQASADASISSLSKTTDALQNLQQDMHEELKQAILALVQLSEARQKSTDETLGSMSEHSSLLSARLATLSAAILETGQGAAASMEDILNHLHLTDSRVVSLSAALRECEEQLADRVRLVANGQHSLKDALAKLDNSSSQMMTAVLEKHSAISDDINSFREQVQSNLTDMDRRTTAAHVVIQSMSDVLSSARISNVIAAVETEFLSLGSKIQRQMDRFEERLDNVDCRFSVADACSKVLINNVVSDLQNAIGDLRIDVADRLQVFEHALETIRKETSTGLENLAESEVKLRLEAIANHSAAIAQVTALRSDTSTLVIRILSDLEEAELRSASKLVAVRSVIQARICDLEKAVEGLCQADARMQSHVQDTEKMFDNQLFALCSTVSEIDHRLQTESQSIKGLVVFRNAEVLKQLEDVTISLLAKQISFQSIVRCEVLHLNQGLHQLCDHFESEMVELSTGISSSIAAVSAELLNLKQRHTSDLYVVQRRLGAVDSRVTGELKICRSLISSSRQRCHSDHSSLLRSVQVLSSRFEGHVQMALALWRIQHRQIHQLNFEMSRNLSVLRQELEESTASNSTAFARLSTETSAALNIVREEVELSAMCTKAVLNVQISCFSTELAESIQEMQNSAAASEARNTEVVCSAFGELSREVSVLERRLNEKLAFVETHVNRLDAQLVSQNVVSATLSKVTTEDFRSSLHSTFAEITSAMSARISDLESCVDALGARANSVEKAIPSVNVAIGETRTEIRSLHQMFDELETSLVVGLATEKAIRSTMIRECTDVASLSVECIKDDMSALREEITDATRHLQTIAGIEEKLCSFDAALLEIRGGAAPEHHAWQNLSDLSESCGMLSNRLEVLAASTRLAGVDAIEDLRMLCLAEAGAREAGLLRLESQLHDIAGRVPSSAEFQQPLHEKFESLSQYIQSVDAVQKRFVQSASKYQGVIEDLSTRNIALEKDVANLKNATMDKDVVTKLVLGELEQMGFMKHLSASDAEQAAREAVGKMTPRAVHDDVIARFAFVEKQLRTSLEEVISGQQRIQNAMREEKRKIEQEITSLRDELIVQDQNVSKIMRTFHQSRLLQSSSSGTVADF
eukprot:ANDGO_01154.mRNA.1 Tip elongation aberrant protein 1